MWLVKLRAAPNKPEILQREGVRGGRERERKRRRGEEEREKGGDKEEDRERERERGREGREGEREILEDGNLKFSFQFMF